MYDRHYCAKIDSVKDRLNAVLREVGLEIHTSRITYGPRLTVKYELRDPGNLTAKVMQSATTQSFCFRHGLPENIIGQKFWHNSWQYEVTGVDPRKPKRSMVLKRVADGKTFISKPDFVKINLGVGA